MGKKVVSIVVRLDPETREKLDYLSKKFGITKVGMIRAILEWTSKNPEKFVEMFILKEIKEIIRQPRPPKVIKKPYCKYCSYRTLCWEDEL